MNGDLETFFTILQDNGFRSSDDRRNWSGQVTVDWKNSLDGADETASHLVTIRLPDGFPFQAPIVCCEDTRPMSASWHLNPGSPPSLCLWDSTTGWRPTITAHQLLHRISDWFFHYHTNSWPDDSQTPDLHLYVQKKGIAIIGDNWQPDSSLSCGPFFLWQSSKFHTTPYLACSDSNLEQRIAEGIYLGKNPTRHKGIWFRLQSPIIPTSPLEELFSRMDLAIGEPDGWSKAKCISVVGKNGTGTGFPIALGFPKVDLQESWLFLWLQFPSRKQKRYKWSLPRNQSQIQVKSFQTAPAGKLDLLRRSQYISQELQGKSVAIFGVGSLGSSLALLLAKAGVSKMSLIDNDILMPGNVARHICGLHYVGTQKTVAAKEIIRKHNPDCDVFVNKTTWIVQEIQQIIADSSVVVDATGNTNFSLFLNRITSSLNHPVMFIAAYRRAKVGRMISCVAEGAPCLACYLEQPRSWSDAAYPTIPARSDYSFIEDGCGAVTEEAVALDVDAVANFGARQVVRFLMDTMDETNLGIIVNEGLDDASNEKLRSPGIHFWNNRAREDCSICRQ